MEGPRTFMNTPRELQDIVLHEYFRDVVITIYPALSDDETEERRKRAEPHPCLTIFHVSKGLHQLARAAFYRHATFHHWAPAISDDFNFCNRYRTGFPSKRFEKVSGDIDFALLLNKGWGVLGFPYARVKDITIKDVVYTKHDDVPDILESLRNLQDRCLLVGGGMKCYLHVFFRPYVWLGNGTNATARVIVNEDAATDLYEVKSMIETQFDIIKKWFDDVFENKLLKPRIWSDQVSTLLQARSQKYLAEKMRTRATMDPTVMENSDNEEPRDGSDEEANGSEEEAAAEDASKLDVEAE
ncbi:hypothetical protein OHC33_007766 [Knufia fluminis]|uniref:Uncharacterized protein n=1 Tax=Knufia fluminis TaxID=191047 RepID=A0AAN8EBT2_9EURO|nr:hypothetical protein OHC33_007766 [Knufia fluminis]